MGFWENKRVLVSGANGFIGAWLCRRLVEEKANVVAVVHQKGGLLSAHGVEGRLKPILADVRNGSEIARLCRESRPEACFHLAAKSSTRQAAEDIREAFTTNVNGTLNVVGSAAEAGAATVFVSTVKVYGGYTESCFDEEQKLEGTTAYATSKIAAEAVCRALAKNNNASISIARLGNVFGGYDNKYSRLVPGAIKNLLEGKRPVILGKGKSIIDMVYVEDAVEGMLLLGEKTIKERMEGGAFNFGSGKAHSVREIVGEIASIMGKKTRPVSKGEEAVCRELLCTEKTLRELRWKARHSLHCGLEKTIEAFRKTLAAE
jgi:CDP-glucose 4,6-dehydratase